MSEKNRRSPGTQARVELHCLTRALIPMPEDNGRKAAKVVAVIFTAAWVAITVALSLETIPAVTPPFYGAFTAVVFLLIGRLWNIEVEQFLPTQ